MYISPPIAVMAILAAGLTSTAWLPPQPRGMAQATVMLPAATYQKLALWGKEHISADGHPRDRSARHRGARDEMGERVVRELSGDARKVVIKNIGPREALKPPIPTLKPENRCEIRGMTQCGSDSARDQSTAPR